MPQSHPGSYLTDDMHLEGKPGPPGPAGPAGPVGPPGPTAISTDIDNLAKLGSDNLLYVSGKAHYVRVLASSGPLNGSIANGQVLQFDTIDDDTDGYAPTTLPFSAITIPAGLGGVYIINGWSSGSGNQSTTLGMGVLVNTVQLTGTNQQISGPGSVNYTLDNAAVAILRLNDGDTVELFNTSVSSGPNGFTSVFMSLARLGS